MFPSVSAVGMEPPFNPLISSQVSFLHLRKKSPAHIKIPVLVLLTDAGLLHQKRRNVQSERM